MYLHLHEVTLHHWLFPWCLTLKLHVSIDPSSAPPRTEVLRTNVTHTLITNEARRIESMGYYWKSKKRKEAAHTRLCRESSTFKTFIWSIYRQYSQLSNGRIDFYCDTTEWTAWLHCISTMTKAIRWFHQVDYIQINSFNWYRKNEKDVG